MLLIVFRRWIDIDHLLPIMEGFVERYPGQLLCVTLAPTIYLSSDPRLQRFNERHPGCLYSFTELHKPSWQYGVASWIHKIGGARRTSEGISQITETWTFLPSWLRRGLTRVSIEAVKILEGKSGQLYDPAWWRSVLFDRGVSLVTMTWQKTDIVLFKNLVDAAAALTIPTAVVPRSVELIDHRKLPTRMATMNQYDHIIVSTQAQHERAVLYGNEPERLKVLGSPRFTSAWRERFLRTYSNHNNYYNNRKKKRPIVGLFHSILEEDFSILQALANVGEFDIIFQDKQLAQGRVGAISADISDLPNVTSDHKRSALEIVADCDLVVCGTSSIMIDAFLERIPVVYPAFQIPLVDGRDVVAALHTEVGAALAMAWTPEEVVMKCRETLVETSLEKASAAQHFLDTHLPDARNGNVVIDRYISLLKETSDQNLQI